MGFLPDKQEQAVQTFLRILIIYKVTAYVLMMFTEGKISNLKLYMAEHLLLDDIEKAFHSLKDGSCHNMPPLSDLMRSILINFLWY